MTSAGEIGTFVFSVLGLGNGTTPCGSVICLIGDSANPFVSLAGSEVTDELLANGITAVDLIVPVPASIWFMLSGLCALWKLGRR